MERFFDDYLERLQLLDRDFVATFDGLPAEALDWVPGEQMNSFCVLVVHTTAAARYWIGDAALDDPSKRNRDEEFRARGLSADDLKGRFAALERYVEAGLARLTLADLAADHTLTNRDGRVIHATTGYGLLHALSHTGLHLGHAQITRQLLERR